MLFMTHRLLVMYGDPRDKRDTKLLTCIVLLGPACDGEIAYLICYIYIIVSD